MTFQEEFFIKINTLLDNSSDYTGTFYPYEVLNNASLPYTIVSDMMTEHWMTLGNVTNGEQGKIMLTTFSDSPSEVVELVQAINEQLHLASLETTNYNIISLKRNNLTRVLPTSDDDDVWFQLISFDFIVEVK